MDLWSKKQLRSIYDPTIEGYWFSVIDLCAILTDSEHEAARGYWKWLKDKLSDEEFQLVSVTNQLKFESVDGKLYYTEVVDYKNLIYLIQLCPSPKANKYRMWVVGLLLDGISMNEVEEKLAKLGEEASEKIVKRYKDDLQEPYVRLATHKDNLLPKGNNAAH